MLMKICGRVRGAFAPRYPENREDEQFHINPRGEQIIAQGLPPLAEIVRMGQSWSAAIPTGSAFTFVNAWPTTRAELVLCNAEDKGSGKAYIIDRAWIVNITSQAAAQPYVLIGQVAQADLAIAQATDNANIIRHHMAGKLTNYPGRAKLALANTAFAVANKWQLLAIAAVSPMTTNLGNGVVADLFGRYIVPPGAAFCIAGVAGTAAGTAIIGVEWHEVDLPVIG